jgi:hypothetical protein
MGLCSAVLCQLKAMDSALERGGVMFYNGGMLSLGKYMVQATMAGVPNSLSFLRLGIVMGCSSSPAPRPARVQDPLPASIDRIGTG